MKRRRIGLWAAVAALTVLLPVSGRAFARNTYVITDGNRTFTYESYATDPAAVLSEAGVGLQNLDTVTAETADGSTALLVQRSHTVSIDYLGQPMTVETLGETVGQLLARLGISPEPEDALSHSADTPVTQGMQIAVRRIFQETQQYTACLPHETLYYMDDSLPAGREEVRVEGRDGQMRCTAQVSYINGQEVSRQVKEQVILTHPVDSLVAVGTGAAAEPPETGRLIIGENTITLATGEVLTYTHTAQVRATAYNHNDEGCDMITATGTTVHIGTVAVDPRYIPYGTRMFIVSNDGVYEYGISVAEDCGGAIKGDRVDLYFPTYSECMQFGRRNCTIYFLG